jgi:hypothetical protein
VRLQPCRGGGDAAKAVTHGHHVVPPRGC